jgi:hypothetical protein
VSLDSWFLAADLIFLAIEFTKNFSDKQLPINAVAIKTPPLKVTKGGANCTTEILWIKSTKTGLQVQFYVDHFS